MKKLKSTAAKISSTRRLEELLEETELELEAIEPQIDKLEKQLEKLRTLKRAKQKLITLKLSIKSILQNFSDEQVGLNTTKAIEDSFSDILSPEKLKKNYSSVPGTSISTAPPGYTGRTPKRPDANFLPDLAFQEASLVLRRKSSINYELFRAIVFKGGQASTEEIKQYLVENNIKQPASGESFEQVELTDISSRINYLVRKGLVEPDGRGMFVSRIGWQTPAGNV